MRFSALRRARMTPVAAAALLAFAALALPVPPQEPPLRAPVGTEHRVREASFHSPALGREVRYRVVVPEDYDRGARRYPVLYLLHGLYGDYRNWTTRTDLVRYVAGRGLIVAMPDAGDSWYANAPGEPAARYEDFLLEDFLAEVDARFRTVAARQSRAIAGLSMGGYGAVKLALRRPERFGFAASFSGALNAARELEDEGPEFRDGLRRALGPPASPARRREDVFALLAAADPAALPYFYLDCGSSDFLLEANRRFVARLQARGAAYEYHEVPGGHDWSYWDRRLPEMLRALLRELQLGPEPKN